MDRNREELALQIKKMVIQSANLLDVSPHDIGDGSSLFGEGLGLDSVDLLELVINLDKRFGLKIKNDQQRRTVLNSISTIVTAIIQQAGLQEVRP